MYGNTTAFQFDGTELTVSNSVIVGGTVFQFGVPRGNNNVIWNAALGLGYSTLHELQEATTGWSHSVYADPGFINPASLDFHEVSQAGRYSPAVTNFVTTDTTNSILVDFGTPASTAYTNEVLPNGSRINAGLYGGTAEASKSRTNAWVFALSFNDGGTLSVPGDTVYWTAGNIPTNGRVRIELSADSGVSWVIVETNLLANAGAYTWANTNFDSSLFGKWRVVYEANTNIADAIDTNIIFRSGNFSYFVNDASINGDVYCTAPGSDTNLGTSAGSPKASLASLLADHDVEPGDTVYIDTGVYTLSGNPTVTILDSGSATGRVTFLGSTNKAAGGTVFNRVETNASTYALYLNGAQHVDVMNITVRNAGTGVRVENSGNIRLHNVVARNCFEGYRILNSSEVTLDHSAAAVNANYGVVIENSNPVRLDHDVLWMNRLVGLYVVQGGVTLSNSIVAASGDLAYALRQPTTTNIVSDYNALFARDAAAIGTIDALGRNIDTLGAWTAFTGRDAGSLETDPLIADETSLDFHLQTETPNGRYLAGYGHVLSDPRTSPLIDAGHPGADYSSETAPNGGRVDIGMYGNTEESSFGRTNAHLLLAVLRDGGWTRSNAALHWVAYQFTNGATARVDASTDGGESWFTLTNGVPVTNELVYWNTLATGATPAALWRVVSLSDTGILDAATNFFALRNSNLTIYVNNSGTNGDVYATAVGQPTNWTAAIDRPMSSLDRVFNLYDIEPGDRILLDAGTYTNNTVSIGRGDSGMAGSPVVVLGSTNEAEPSVLLHTPSFSNTFGLVVHSAGWLAISNVGFHGNTIGVLVTNSSQVSLGVRSASNTVHGMLLRNSSSLSLNRAVLARNGGDGVVVDRISGLTIQHSVIWSNDDSGLVVTSSTVQVSNTVVGVDGDNNYAFRLAGAGETIQSDYNNIQVGGGAQIGLSGGTPYKQLYRWQSATFNDVHSLSHDPGFADAAALDFHEKSTAGRFTPSGLVVTDAVSSILLDAGHPGASFANEPLPNGGRVNVGLFGNTTRTSLSPTNGWLVALTLSSGGAFRGTNALYWNAGGAATGDLVSIDYSSDGGVTWSNIASNVAATAGSIIWTSTPYLGSTMGKWQVRSENDTNVVDDTDSFFSLNNSGLDYFVNDASVAGDVYCSASGVATNDGLSSATPALSVHSILSRYDLSEGDRIFVDTGFYTITNAITIDANIVGHPTNRVSVIGSTNRAAGGSVIRQVGLAPAFDVRETTSIGIHHFVVSGAVVGVRLLDATNCVIESVSAMRPVTGFDLHRAESNLFVNCAAIRFIGTGLVQQAGQANVWIDGVLSTVGTSGTCVRVTNGTLVVSNTVVLADGPFAVGFSVGPAGQLASDYNNVYATNGGYAGVTEADGRWLPVHDTLTRWVEETGRDRHSLSHDPLLYDTGGNDFHALSRVGRFDPVTAMFVADIESSVLLDAGHPGGSFTNEPVPNGGRRNIGPHSDTVEASQSDTGRFVTVVALNDGGRAQGTNVTLYWIARGAASNAQFRLQYSPDGGASWALIASNVPASTSFYAWNSLGYTSSMRGLWRIMNQADNIEEDRSDRPFALRNQPITFFVNDADTAGDIYSLAIGDPTNHGLSAGQPLPSLAGLLAAYDLEAGDTIYVDTGTYTGAANIAWGQLDSGLPNNPIRVVGSTNEGAGGTVFSGIGFDISYLQGLELQDLKLRMNVPGSTARAVSLFQSSNVVLRGVQIRGGNNGIHVDRSGDIILERSSVHSCLTNGVLSIISGRIVIDSSVLWSNRFAVSTDASGVLSISNSIIGTYGSNNVALIVRSTLHADYNNYYLREGSILGIESGFPVDSVYESLAKWRASTGRDAHSLSHDPMFIDAAGGDFRLKSQAGRYDPSVEAFVLDAVTSPLIDASDPSVPFSTEPVPHGNRRNMGMQANTMFASMTPTNSVITVASLNDGGIANGTNFTLYWVARGAVTGDTVSVQVSHDGGATWHVVASNVPATGAPIPWDVSAESNTLTALWRVVGESDTNAWDVSDQVFAIRLSPFEFFVNDASTAGDVYTLAPGSSTNTGLSALQPKASLTEVLDTYNIEPGDTIYVDTGLYSSPNSIRISQADSAEFTNAPRVLIQGSTNYASGGTVLDGQNREYGILAASAVGMEYRNLKIRNAKTGIFLQRAYASVLDRVDVEGGDRGFDVFVADNIVFDHCSVRSAALAGLNFVNGNYLKMEHSVLWSNGTAAINAIGGSLFFSNSVIGVFGSNNYAYSIQAGSITADYNNIRLVGGASAAFVAASPVPTIYQTLSRWVRDNAQDVHSLSHDPGFVAPASGDFHERSVAGHFAVTSGTFVVDLETSPLVDAGSPAGYYTNELDPNGLRLNIGLYGGTPEASLSPTNASLTAVTFSDGGQAEGTNVSLYWVARGDATGHAVRLDYSSDDGVSWQPLATNLQPTNAIFSWNSIVSTSSMLGVWKVTSLSDSNVYDATDRRFALHNTNLYFYVNDASTVGDIYCTAPGSSTNSGLTPDQPMLDIRALLAAWDLEPGDIVYVDTGSYAMNSPVHIDRFDAGLRTNNPAYAVTIQGSTNDAAGGTVFNFSGGDGIRLNFAPNIRLYNLTVRGATRGLYAERSEYGDVQYFRAERCTDGYDISDCAPFQFRNCLAWANADKGLYVRGAFSQVSWTAGVLWSNQFGVYMDQGLLEVQNTIIGAFGVGSFPYHYLRGLLDSDYNNIVLRDNALCAIVYPSGVLGTASNRYETVASWTRAFSNDVFSLTFHPEFADEVGGDFHLKSSNGRFVPGAGWTNDTVTSLLIDSGNPQSPYDNEPPLNGGRINIDLYANTWQATKTPTNGWLSIISFNDGGSAQGENVEMRFFAGWIATGHLVTVDYSGDAGVTWTNIVSNHPAANPFYTWNSVPYGRSAVSQWRIISEDDTNLFDISDEFFVLRNGGTIEYYVNDASTLGDVYTTAPGATNNSGLLPSVPLASIQDVLGRYTLEPVDIIFVDTGTYLLTNAVQVNDLDSGTSNEFVLILGSTNFNAGGSVLDRQIGSDAAISLFNAQGVQIRNFTVRNAGKGVEVLGARHCLVENVRAEDNESGFVVTSSDAIDLLRCVSRLNSSNGLAISQSQVNWRNGVIWDNPAAVSVRDASMLSVRDSVLRVSGYGRRVISKDTVSSIVTSDYNNILAEDGALILEEQQPVGGNLFYDFMYDWQKATTQDLHSLSHAPFFADEGSGDYHLRSIVGRILPGGATTNDAEHSPMIDTGDPASSYTNEPPQNGSRANIGLYGGSADASLSRTNPWLLAITLNDGGTIRGTNNLYWAYGGGITATNLHPARVLA
jgi:hypothetical protein